MPARTKTAPDDPVERPRSSPKHLPPSGASVVPLFERDWHAAATEDERTGVIVAYLATALGQGEQILALLASFSQRLDAVEALAERENESQRLKIKQLEAQLAVAARDATAKAERLDAHERALAWARERLSWRGALVALALGLAALLLHEIDRRRTPPPAPAHERNR